MDDATWQRLIIAQVGDVTTPDFPNGVLFTLMPNMWATWQSKRVFSVRLQALYTKRDCIDLVLAPLRYDVDATIPEQMSTKESQKIGYLNGMRTVVEAEIAQLEKKYRATRPPVLTPLVTTTPISVQDEINRENNPPEPSLPDPNAPELAGSPYLPMPFTPTP